VVRRAHRGRGERTAPVIGAAPVGTRRSGRGADRPTGRRDIIVGMEVRRLVAAAGALAINALAAAALLGASSDGPRAPARIEPVLARLLPPPEPPPRPPEPAAVPRADVPPAPPEPAPRRMRADSSPRAERESSRRRAVAPPAIPPETPRAAPPRTERPPDRPAPAALSTPPALVATAPAAATVASRPVETALPKAEAPTAPTAANAPTAAVAAAQPTSAAPPSAPAPTDAGSAQASAVARAAADTGLSTGGAGAPVRRTGPRIDASWSGNAAPPYPASARRMGEQGEVRLDVHVGADGAVIDVRLRTSSGSPTLDRSAIDAVRRWRFRPATVDGQAVSEWYRDWKWVFRLEG
jgi:protein TonB